jgi:hypothetical protein
MVLLELRYQRGQGATIATQAWFEVEMRASAASPSSTFFSACASANATTRPRWAATNPGVSLASAREIIRLF